MISFDNTEYAFEYKTSEELKKARFLFKAMGNPALLKLGLAVTPLAIKWNIPFTKSALRSTIFKQFVGGETLQQTAVVANKLEQYNVKVILDYGVEGGAEGETGFEESTAEFIKVIDYAASQNNIPFMSIKVTGFVRFGLLEKLDAAMHNREGTLIKRYSSSVEALPPDEKEEWQRCVDRFERICETASQKNIGVLVDAEETWIQDPVDAMTMLMMDHYNKEKVVVYNTLQLYRHDRLAFLKDSYTASTERNFILAVKLVRGAYMENERRRAAEKGYASPIQPTKESCDADYDQALEFCVHHLDNIAVIVASHNEKSNLYATQLLDRKGLSHHHPHIHFSQLYGMSDHITFNLAKSNCSVSKYLPFGPIKDVVPYLMRRAQENSSVAGQTGRELGLIKKELQRRKV
ncbi:MAG: proline dehydrogenase family protein [Gloeobacteraceae cyanobacterium ES-bin-316]|nr:proline dehydrogenase family protein [Ferruginibacter sp.]